MYWGVRQPLKVVARAASLRRRVAYSLAIVRLILVPVIFLAIYYLFYMGSIVDQIVSVDAQLVNLAETVSTSMVDARRAERNYFLLHDAADLLANRQAVSRLEQALEEGLSRQPEEQESLANMRAQVKIYHQRFEDAVARMEQPNEAPAERIREVLQAYQRDLNGLLRRRYKNGSQLIQELQNQVGSLDAQVAATLITEDPGFRQITFDLGVSSNLVLRQASELEKRSRGRVQHNLDRTHKLRHRAEWVLITVSALTFLLSVWVSFVLPRQVVRPLAALKAAVDRAAAGDYEIEFDVQGESEVAQLAGSVRQLIAHVRETKAKAT